MADYLPQASNSGQTQNGHEANTLVVKGLVIFRGGAGSPCRNPGRIRARVYVMRDFSHEEKSLEALAPPTFPDDTEIRSRSATSGRTTHRLVRRKRPSMSRLNGYGWVDHKAGIAHIPIDRAMEIVVAVRTSRAELALARRLRHRILKPKEDRKP